jgi:peptidoglycan/xylan/chitin deacetylase (PgdA/CDA1 family)
MVTSTILNRQRLLFIVVAVALVVMLVNPYLARFSTAARSHHIQNRMKTPKGLSGSSGGKDKSSSSSSPSPMQSISNNNNNNNNYGRVVIINFDDSHESDYTYAKPILDKYGFKATFFEVCNWVEAGYHESDISATWQQIAALQQDGMDIEAHTMTHPILNDLSSVRFEL